MTNIASRTWSTTGCHFHNVQGCMHRPQATMWSCQLCRSAPREQCTATFIMMAAELAVVHSAFAGWQGWQHVAQVPHIHRQKQKSYTHHRNFMQQELLSFSIHTTAYILYPTVCPCQLYLRPSELAFVLHYVVSYSQTVYLQTYKVPHHGRSAVQVPSETIKRLATPRCTSSMMPGSVTPTAYIIPFGEPFCKFHKQDAKLNG